MVELEKDWLDEWDEDDQPAQRSKVKPKIKPWKSKPKQPSKLQKALNDQEARINMLEAEVAELKELIDKHSLIPVEHENQSQAI